MQRLLPSIRRVVVHSAYPILSIAILGGTFFWGPWPTLALAILAWKSIGYLA